VIVTEFSEELAKHTADARSNGRVGFVPTMGFLHQGHASLIEQARKECDFVVVSIFVNPTQFGEGEDFDRYPRDMKADTTLCESLGVDALFIPSVDEMYPSGETAVVSFPSLSKKLCGAFRPGHFDGVTTIMTKLLSIVGECRCYMGMKDAQQVLLVKKLLADLHLPVTVVAVPTMRDAHGLALSSRNAYLSEFQRKTAQNIYQQLDGVAIHIEQGEKHIAPFLQEARARLESLGFDVQYFSFVQQEDFEDVDDISEGDYLLCVAAVIGNTRLIDNFFVDVAADNSVAINRGVGPTLDDHSHFEGTEAAHV
jgi:pantoate--beta-alanine ligase